jgi:hypothetical protein
MVFTLGLASKVQQDANYIVIKYIKESEAGIRIAISEA